MSGASQRSSDGRSDLLLIRHGEAPPGPDGDDPDQPLSEEGERQARAVATRLTGVPFDRLVTSPVVRARRTADVIAAACGIEVEVDEDFREFAVPDYAAQTAAEVSVRLRTGTWDGWTGEDPGAFATRVRRGIERLAIPDSVTVVTCHGGLINAVLAAVFGGSFRLGLYLENTAITHLLVHPDGHWELAGVNDAHHLGDRLAVPGYTLDEALLRFSPAG